MTPITQPYALSPKIGLRPGTEPAAARGAVEDSDRQWSADETNEMRRLGFSVGVLFIFLRFSFLHEIITSRLGPNLYLLLIVGFLATLLALASGGFRRTFNTRAGKWWAWFTAWMVLTVPFSTWQTDSGLTALSFIRVTLPSMIVIAGLAMSLKECFRMMSAIALAGVVNVVYARFFDVDEALRLGMTFGSIANPNDYAAHLLLILPFLLWVALSSTSTLIRIAGFGLFIFGVFVAASSGSRGAMVAASAAVLFAFVRTSGMPRLAILIGAPILVLTVVSIMPERLLTRYATLFQQDEPMTIEEALQATDEALQSRETRRYLLATGLGLTLRNPLFGVGPGQFANVEGRTAVDRGVRGVWQVSHNTYLQVSSESGIPALIFFAAAIIVTFRIFNSLYRQCRLQPQFRKLRHASFCLMLSMVGYCTAIFFLSMAYSSYLPVMTGLAIALHRAFQHEMRSVQKPASSANLA